MNSRRIAWVAACAAAGCMFFAAAPVRAAVDAYLKIEGVKQGQIKGGVMSGNHKDAIAVLSCASGQHLPKDAAAGVAAGKRMHQSFVITKEVDQASPKLMAAMRTGEMLKSVDVDFVHGDATYKQVHMNNAIITAIHVNGAGPHATEEITIEADEVEYSVNGKKAAMDDWMARN